MGTSTELNAAVEEMRDRVAPEIQPVLDALAGDSDGVGVEEAWQAILGRALNEA
jgi:hypothetical protein